MPSLSTHGVHPPSDITRKQVVTTHTQCLLT
jgi:hypothetical protein